MAAEEKGRLTAKQQAFVGLVALAVVGCAKDDGPGRFAPLGNGTGRTLDTRTGRLCAAVMPGTSLGRLTREQLCDPSLFALDSARRDSAAKASSAFWAARDSAYGGTKGPSIWDELIPDDSLLDTLGAEMDAALDSLRAADTRGARR
jgi:hypothetical protein